MDPQAAWEHYLRSRGAEKRAYRSALLGWIRGGGFEPRWTESERRKFMNTKHRGTR